MSGRTLVDKIWDAHEIAVLPGGVHLVLLCDGSVRHAATSQPTPDTWENLLLRNDGKATFLQ